MAYDEKLIRQLVLTELGRQGSRYAPVGVSVKHVHVSRKDLDILFGSGYELSPLRDLVQPGQYAAKEQVTLVGPKGRLEKVRIIGPVRKETQVEVSKTDSVALGIKDVPVRISGDIQNTPGITLVGPKGEVTVSRGLMVAARHLHLSAAEAAAFGVHNGQVVNMRMSGERAGILENVVCRTGDGHELEFHVDTDEANAFGMKSGDLLQVMLPGEPIVPCEEKPVRECQKMAGEIAGRTLELLGKAGASEGKQPETGACGSGSPKSSGNGGAGQPDGNVTVLDLVTEKSVNEARERRQKAVYCEPKALITPAASDRARELGIEIRRASRPEVKPVAVPRCEEDILDLVTERDLNDAFRDDVDTIFCSARALITTAAADRAAETGIRIVRVRQQAPD